MSKKLISILVVILLVAACVSSCGIKTANGDEEAVIENIPDVTSYLSQEEWEETVASNYVEQIDGVTTVVVKEWYDDYTIYVAYPVISASEDASAEIKNFIDEKISLYEAEIKANSGQLFETKPELTITYEPFVFSDSTISFKFVTYADSGSVRTVNYIDTFVYDKNSGEKVELSNLFKEDSDYLSVLSSAVKGVLEKDVIIQDYSDSGLLESGTKPEEGSFDNFVISNKDIIFYYNQGEVAPAVAGSFEAPVSHDSLGDVLSNNFINGKSLLESSSASSVDLPPYLQNGENEMPAYSIDGIDPINDKVIAMTFDDGPAPDKTMKVVEAFQSVGGKCTFFMVGTNVAEYPEIVKQVYDAGMEIGNHGYNHINYFKVSYEEMVEEIEKTNDGIEAATGKRPILFRAPYGNVSAEAAEQYGRQSVYWTVDTLDWKNRDVDMNYENAVNGAYDGAIVLMHDIHAETVAAIPRIVNRLTELGYKLVSVSQLDQILIARGQDPTWRVGRDASTAKPKDLASDSSATEEPAAE